MPSFLVHAALQKKNLYAKKNLLPRSLPSAMVCPQPGPSVGQLRSNLKKRGKQKKKERKKKDREHHKKPFFLTTYIRPSSEK